MPTVLSSLGIGEQNGISRLPGIPHSQVLRVAANVASDETVVIGPDTYRVAIVNTDSTKNTTKALAAERFTDEFYMASHGLIVGDAIRIESEFCRVVAVLDANRIALERGISGSTIATHTTPQDIYTEAAPGDGGIPVCLTTTLTPAVFTDALVADINARGSADVRAYGISDNMVVVVAWDKANAVPASPGTAYDTTETLAGANNVWGAAAMAGGLAPHIQMIVRRVPTAAEVALGYMVFTFPFTPAVVATNVFTTATLAHVVWDGDATVSGYNVILDNAGSVDWSANETVELVVRGT